MRRRRVIIVLTVCVLVGIAMVAFWSGEREPEYNGKKLSEWLRTYELGSSSVNERMAIDRQQQVAAAAIQHIGTNALPWLLKRLAYKPQGWKEKMALYIAKTHSKILIHWYVEHTDDQRLAYEALLGFRLLGSNAAPSVPELARMAKDGTRQGIGKDSPMEALSYIGQEALPTFLAALTNRETQHKAAYWVCQLPKHGVDISPAIPALLLIDRQRNEQLIKSWSGGPFYHDSNFYALPGLLDENRPFLIPALTNCLHHMNSNVRVEAAKALGSLYGNARPAVPALREALGDHVIAVQVAAAAALEKIPSPIQTNGLQGL